MAREEHQLLTGTCDEGSYQGQFLIATPVIGSGFFNRSLTYLCHHDADGAMGIVIN
ncbi:MAG: YqgE/AlgH family protein, partial [Pseudomonadales bacterium]